MTIRVAVVASHPIQHFCPQYASWAKMSGLDLKVFFASRRGLDAYEDKDFGRVVQWRLTMDFPHGFFPAATATATGKGPAIGHAGVDAVLDDFAPQLLVVYGYSQPLQRRAMAWARRNRCHIAMMADSELRARRSWLKRVAKRALLPRILKQVDVFLTVGDANEAYYRHYGADDRRFVRTFFPIDTGYFDAVLSKRESVRTDLRRSLGIDDDQIVILMVGKLVAWKRQIDLVRFANLVGVQRRDVTVLLAGTGADESSLKAEASRLGTGGVLFAGFVPPENLVGYYAAADIYAHCSSTEPHSLAVSEAIYAGLPVVISDRCGSYGPTDDVRAGLNGLVYRCGDPADLRNSLLRLVDDRALRAEMGRESSQMARPAQTLAHGKALRQAIELLGGELETARGSR